MDLWLTKFGLAGTGTAAVDIVMPLANAKHLTVHADVGAAGIMVADEDKVKQMLLNLLSNAIKFTPDRGAVKVVVDGLPDEVRVCVADTGIGISADDQQRLFQEFQQLE